MGAVVLHEQIFKTEYNEIIVEVDVTYVEEKRTPGGQIDIICNGPRY